LTYKSVSTSSNHSLEQNGRLDDIERFVKHPTTRAVLQLIGLVALDKFSGSQFYFSALLGLSFGLAAYRSGIPKEKGNIRWAGFIVYTVCMAISAFGILGVLQQSPTEEGIFISVSNTYKSISYWLSKLCLSYVNEIYIWVCILAAGVFDWVLITSPQEARVKADVQEKVIARTTQKKKKRKKR
jgi:hypothetical protein